MLWSGIVSGERMELLDHQKKRGIWMLFVTLFEWESWHHRREPWLHSPAPPSKFLCRWAGSRINHKVHTSGLLFSLLKMAVPW